MKRACMILFTLLILFSLLVLPALAAPPTITITGTPAVVAGSGQNPLFGTGRATITFTDADSANLNGGFVEITQTGGTTNGSWALGGTVATAGGDASIAAGETITVNGTAIGQVVLAGQVGGALRINLNANATPARVEALLQDLNYSVPSGVGDRSFALVVNDGAGAATATLTISITQNPPDIQNLGDTVSIVTGGSPVNIDSGSNATVTDPDNLNFNGGALTITQQSGTANGSFSLTGSGGTGAAAGSDVASADGTIANGESIFVNGVAIGTVANDGQNGNTLQINFTANATPANVQVVLRALQYTAPSGAGTRTFEVAISDAAPAPGTATGLASFTVEVVDPVVPVPLPPPDTDTATGATDPIIGPPKPFLQQYQDENITLSGDGRMIVNEIVSGISPGGLTPQQAARIGDSFTVQQGIISAVDVFVPIGGSVSAFSATFDGAGSVIYLPAAAQPRQPQVLPVTRTSSTTSAVIPGPGTVVFVRSLVSPGAADSAGSSAIAVIMPVEAGCTVTTNNILTLRAAPTVTSRSLTRVRAFEVLAATRRADVPGDVNSPWYEVRWQGQQGWLASGPAGRFLTLSAACN
jgi:hypothetical protein